MSLWSTGKVCGNVHEVSHIPALLVVTVLPFFSSGNFLAGRGFHCGQTPVFSVCPSVVRQPLLYTSSASRDIACSVRFKRCNTHLYATLYRWGQGQANQTGVPKPSPAYGGVANICMLCMLCNIRCHSTQPTVFASFAAATAHKPSCSFFASTALGHFWRCDSGHMSQITRFRFPLWLSCSL